MVAAEDLQTGLGLTPSGHFLAYQAHVTAQAAALAATADKEGERAQLEDLARQLAQLVQKYPGMTDAVRR